MLLFLKIQLIVANPPSLGFDSSECHWRPTLLCAHDLAWPSQFITAQTPTLAPAETSTRPRPALETISYQIIIIIPIIIRVFIQVIVRLILNIINIIVRVIIRVIMTIDSIQKHLNQTAQHLHQIFNHSNQSNSNSNNNDNKNNNKVKNNTNKNNNNKNNLNSSSIPIHQNDSSIKKLYLNQSNLHFNEKFFKLSNWIHFNQNKSQELIWPPETWFESSTNNSNKSKINDQSNLNLKPLNHHQVQSQIHQNNFNLNQVINQDHQNVNLLNTLTTTTANHQISSSIIINDSPQNTQSIQSINPSNQDTIQFTNSPQNTQSIQHINQPHQDSIQFTNSPQNTQSIQSINPSNQDSIQFTNSPQNTQSIQSINQSNQDSIQFTNSPQNTQSILLPNNPHQSNQSITNLSLQTHSVDIHSNSTQQLSPSNQPNPNSFNPSNTILPPSPPSQSPQPIQSSSNSSNNSSLSKSFNQFNHFLHPKNLSPFKPPPPHPSIIAQKSGGQIIVKETLDAHSTLSQDGKKQVNQYIIQRELGRGSFGAVQLAVDAETGLEYAIKECSKSRLKRKFARELRVLNQSFDENNDALFLIRSEVAIMKKLRHPNVVKLHEVLDVTEEDSLYMVMEYCRGGPLMSRDPNSSEYDGQVKGDTNLARKYFRQLIVGIDYLHSNEVIHHDIKPDNILLSSDRKQIKVVDFGISAMFSKPGDDGSVTRTFGSPGFLSPELLKSEPEAIISGTASDIWSMGVTLYCMLTGKLPFGQNLIIDVYHAIENEAPVLPDEWDSELLDLMAKILDKDPRTRIKMKELKSHAWVTHSGKLPILASESTNQINRHNTELEIKESFRFGITNHCPVTKAVFFEILENSVKHCRKFHQDHIGRHHQNRRGEFFKEFYRQIAERAPKFG
ncbi:hypothetical protein O181_068097 [Austropuccinia psidii MF-1]|uniref:Protein kinase domain-containing protein n=1 Tax=Austropuccinia psidii MF-1 TaxID=1389203 RepID=A0A9Q3EYN6_9BASI|nr:hypothetical protein [Austropuccinia psidii MF-1]